MKIIVTGALGHIGSKLIQHNAFSQKDLEIIMVDNLSTQRYCSLFNLSNQRKYSFIEHDVRLLDWSQLLTTDVNAVIHLAALTDAAGTADKPQEVYENNFEATKIIADACFDKEIPLVFPSSTSIYGSQSNLVDETCTELQPQSPYAGCKIKEEAYLLNLFKQGLKGVICRLGTIYGISPGMRFHTAVNKFCWQAVMRQPLTVWETAIDQKRPYLNLTDCCNAFTWILLNSLYNGEIYNIVSDNLTVRDVLKEIKTHILALQVNYTQHKIMNQLSYEVSSDKLMNTGFNIDANFSKNIKETINLLKNANI